MCVLKKKTERGGRVIDVATPGCVDILAGEKMDVGSAETNVPLDAPFQIDVERGGHVARGVSIGGHRDETWNGANRILLRIAPKKVGPAIDRDVFC